MKQPTQEQLLSIAQAHLSHFIHTFSSQNDGSSDFVEVSVWNIEAALRAAYELGAKEEAEE